MGYLRISEVAELLGVSTSTLRSWDYSKTFVPERRFKSGERRYSEEQVKELLERMDVGKADDIGEGKAIL